MDIKMNGRGIVVLAVMLPAIFPVTGCVRRTLKIETEPQGAMVYLNDEEVGPTPVSRDFTWYGDYDVIIRKDGFETLQTNIVVLPPWYQIPPVDFVADVLWPATIHDVHQHSFTLDPRAAPEHDEVVAKALSLREEALFEDQ
ncbi:MAG: PEGA domain-containing protein [Phycisphaerae bacterium]